MSPQDNVDSRRRRTRREVEGRVDVVDCMTGQVVGRIANISESGMLLLASAPLHTDALYQLRFDLAGPGDEAFPIEPGAHVLWQEPDRVPSRTWAGLHFIHLRPSHRKLLLGWLGQ